jgi:1-acyl-sn-glycerol-3-phosphate acyltransferase
MKKIVNFLGKVYSVYAIFFPSAVVASLFGKKIGGNMMIRLSKWGADIWFFLIFIRVKRIYEAPLDKTRQYVFVSNHISFIDPAIAFKAYRQPFRTLAKIEMAKIPIMGFVYKYVTIMVDRDDPKSRIESLNHLRSVLNDKISVLIMPEGTFNKGNTPLKEFHDGPFYMAIESKTPIKPVLFLDSYRRMKHNSYLSMTPGQCRILYLNEIPVDGYSVFETRKLRDLVYQTMERKMIEYNAAYPQLD